MKEPVIRILHLEDFPTEAELAEIEIKKVLTEYEIKVVDNELDFRSALGIFKPHIVISDYQLPAFDGLKALGIVMEQSPLTPLIMLTGSMNEDTAVICLKAGAIDYVIKEHIKRLGPAILNALESNENKLKKIQIEEKLKKSEEKFRSLFENHSAAKFLIDAETGAIVDANLAASNFYGWSVNELEQMNISEISTLTENEIADERSKIKNNISIPSDFVHRSKNGNLKNVEVFSSSVEIDGKSFIHSIVHDITEKKIAEQKIILLSKAIEQSPVSVVITEPNGNMEYVNARFTEITGYSFNEIIGKNLRILKSGEQSEVFYKSMWETITSGKVWSGEIRNKKKNKELYWESVSISPLVDDLGQITHFIGIKEDITERKRILNELVVAKEKAEESERLKTAFLHNISHEIRTPMNAIVGFSSLLEYPGLPQDQVTQYVEIIVNSSNQLLSVITDIINIATLEAGQEMIETKTMNLNTICNDLYDKFLPKAQAKQISFSVETYLSQNEAECKTDENKLTQVLNQLIGNALKFTKQGHIKFGYKLKNDQDQAELEFYVEDTGIGIAKEMFEEIFIRFRQVESTTARNYGGSGLGLTLSKAYIELLGGKLWLDSELGKGSTFYFTIPYRLSIPEVLSTKESIPGSKTGAIVQKTLLIAEDEDSNYMLLEHVLSGLKVKIIRANDGAEAVEICKSTAIDLILMDVKMPVMDGYEATKLIRVFNKELPIIALTAYSTEADKK
ncbi:MAG: PAS domain S-box protein, partial [Bacteroidales bacterium]|nr:PAS domain S-box protein [Bacteroidales bacterium]